MVTTPQGWDAFPSGFAGLAWNVVWHDTSAAYPACPFPPAGRPAVANLEIQTNAIPWGTADEGTQWVELDTDWFGPTMGPNGSVGNCVTEP